ncbi:MAG TPA: SDR family oxidoreductase [Burkholderiaceae bacterium]|nr:SDR family oxidoreductase [Burkholderiaceae bacterium]
MRVDGARVLFTGAGGGIGGVAVSTLLDAGAAVMLVGRSASRLSSQAHELAHTHGSSRVAWHAADLLCSDAIGALAGAAASFDVNVVVHGAGVPSFGQLQSLATSDLQRVLHINLLAPMLLTQALLPHLRSLPRAQVLFVGSALGRLGLPGFSAYCASKFGLRGFAESLRRELGESTVRVQYLGPRSTRTAFNDAAVGAYNRATGTAMDDPQVVADALLRLLRDDTRAERFIGWPEKLAGRLNALVPTWLDAAFTRHSRCLQQIEPAPVPPSNLSTAP